MTNTSAPPSRPPGAVILVDDDPELLRSFVRTLSGTGYEVETFPSAVAAIDRVRRGGVDVVVSDIAMPGMNGIELLRNIRQYEPDLPVVLVTGIPAIESATEAIEYGVLKYLVKPVEPEALRAAVAQARRLFGLARLKREALDVLGHSPLTSDRAGLEASFERALGSIWMAFQPIVRATDGNVFGYEALLRSNEPALSQPNQLLHAAERLGELVRLGRAVRERASIPVRESSEQPVLFVNLSPEELADPEIVSTTSTLAGIAHRVVLEITERASLDNIEHVRARVAALRALGFRIAVDDLGAGYAGLTSFALLEPEIVKLDMALVREIDTNPVKQKVVGSMTSLCRDMGLLTVAEGIETEAERDVVIELGCDLLQGYLFARPGPPFPRSSWQPASR